MKNPTIIIAIALYLFLAAGIAIEHEKQTELIQKIHKQNEQIIERLK